MTELQTALGATVSSTVTRAVQVAELPAASAMVSTTLRRGTSAQVKSVWLAMMATTPQLSLLPLSRSSLLMLAKPLASSGTVMSWQMAEGASSSVTVTVKVQLAVKVEASVAVAVTVVTPVANREPGAWL